MTRGQMARIVGQKGDAGEGEEENVLAFRP